MWSVRIAIIGVLLTSACVPDVALPATGSSAPPPSPTTTVGPTTTVTTQVPATTMAGFQLPIIDLADAQPYPGDGCSRDQVLLAAPLGAVWVFDVETLEASRLSWHMRPRESPIQAFASDSLLVAGEEGLVLRTSQGSTVLIDPPVSDDVVFAPTVEVLDVFCTVDGSLTLLLVGQFDTWLVGWWAIARVDAAGLISFERFEPSIEADFAQFSPTGEFATLALFGPDPAFGGVWRILDVASLREVEVLDVPMQPSSPDPTIFVGPMIWIDNSTVRQHWKIDDGDIRAANIDVSNGESLEVQPEPVIGWVAECEVKVQDGFVRGGGVGPLAAIDENIVSFCW